MHFRPCIDIHNGKVKQIVGGSLKDQGDFAKENFVSEMDAGFYANLYQQKELKGGHIILLNGKDSPYYEATKKQALLALQTYPQGLQIGGGITPENAEEYLEAGAEKVIVTSYVFQDGQVNFENLEKLKKTVGKEHLVLDLSCRKKEDQYWIVTNRWQNFTQVALTTENIDLFKEYASEFLIHAVDVEGKAQGIEEQVVSILEKEMKDLSVTYAGGVRSMEDLKTLYRLGKGKIDVTVGSALDIFGGTLVFEDVVGIRNW
ncbi:MAG: phosphoribosylformimino-5-aminoimidazole carboxamide ribotide isomerase [Lachnospiraceae bacterium]|nr:phosphoribosylformimino-5-aminoimidazole carboxamide ribotide isomerase [Lachnospiraceae bacterium]